MKKSLGLSVPKHWTSITAGKLCQQTGGELQTGPFGSQLHASDYSDSGTPVVMPKDLVSNKISEESIARVDQYHVDRLSQHKLRSSDIVYSRRGDVTRFAIVTEKEEGWLCGTGCLRVRLNTKNLDDRYLAHFLSHRVVSDWLNRNARGATMPNLNTKILSKLPLLYPSLEEQRRIVEILDLADETRRNQQEIIRLMEEALRSAFLEMFGDPVTNPMGWDVVELGKVTESKLGKMLSQASKEGVSPVPYLGNSNVRWREFDLTSLQEMDFSEGELQKLDLRNGDLLVCEGGEVGRCAIWRCELDKISFQKALHRVRCVPKKVAPEYLQEYFALMASRGGLTRSTSQATIAHLTGVKLKKLPLPLAPYELQEKFVALYQGYEKMRHACIEEERELENLFNALVQAAFRGELTASKAEETSEQLQLFGAA